MDDNKNFDTVNSLVPSEEERARALAMTDEERLAENERQFAAIRASTIRVADPEELAEVCARESLKVVAEVIPELQEIAAKSMPMTGIVIAIVDAADTNLIRIHSAGDIEGVAEALNMSLMEQGVSPVQLLGGVQSLMRNAQQRMAAAQARAEQAVAADKNAGLFPGGA